MSFKENFLWGVAAASYQIEGAAFEDGKGKSVWDMFCLKDGATYEGQTGSTACNHYHLYKEDVAIMKELSIGAYRLSLSWARILPQGIGGVNEKGLDFYDRLFDELLAANIKPFVTLFHWDYPYSLYQRGGWLNPESSRWFEEYTKIVVERFSDRIEDWMTLNEPQCFIGSGHQSGYHAPGDKLGLSEVLLAGHNALLAHGRATGVIRNYAKKKPNIGYAPVGVVKVPADPQNSRDIEAAKKAMFAIETAANCWNNTWWMDPVFFGEYPADGLELYGSSVPQYSDEDMRIISEPVDFAGLNIYNGRETYAAADGTPKEQRRADGFPYTAINWPVVPQSLYWGPKFFYERYAKPIIITENGMANTDWLSLDGAVHDPQRIDFLHRYLSALKDASKEIDIRGYFHWSFTDNFEWAFGFSKRFGLIFIDYPAQKRIIKDSGYWYKNVINSNGSNL